MTNEIAEGKTITLTATGAVTSGSPILIGGVLAVPVTSAASGEQFAAALEGVFSIPKAAEAVSQGDKLYWDASVSKVTKTPGTNSKPLVGFAWEGAALRAAVVQIKLIATLATGPSA